MRLSDEQIHGLDIALNESSLLGLEVDPNRRVAGATFAVLSLPEVGDVPTDRRIQMIFRPVRRVVASLRHGQWNDANAEVEKFQLADLLAVVQRFGGKPIYGREFIDSKDEGNFTKWVDRLSLDFRSTGWIRQRIGTVWGNIRGSSHSIFLFQEGPKLILDIKLWFDDIEIRNPQGEEIGLDEFIAGGRRWWDALYAGDERTKGFGIFPMKKDSGSIPWDSPAEK